MPMRPRLPLDPTIAQRASQQLEAAYRDQPMPNFLFDAQGQRRSLSADEPCSRALMEEWTEAYAASGGDVDADPVNNAEVGEAVEPCSRDEHRVQIVDPWERGVADVNCIVRLADGREIDAVTDGEGYVELPEDYHGEVELLVEDQPFDVTEPAPPHSSTPRQEGYAHEHDDEDAYLTGQMIIHI